MDRPHTRRLRVALLLAPAFLLLAAGPAGAAVLVGTWNNTTFGSSGALTVDIEITATTFDFTADADGPAFGVGDAPPVPLSGAREPDGSVVVNIVDDPFFGDIAGAVSPAGELDILATNIPAGVHSMSLVGTIDQAQMTGNYQVNFVDLTQVPEPVEGQHFAVGTFNAVPEPASAALLGLAGLALTRRRRG